jgi:hypothetical protein
MSVELVLIVGYIVGTLVGLHFGFSYGVRRGSSLTVDLMIKNNFVKWRRVKGDIELLKIDQ